MPKFEWPEEIREFVARLPITDGQIHVCTCAGIGDFAWTWSKWHAVAAERPVKFWFPEGEPHRVHEIAALYGIAFAPTTYLPHDDAARNPARIGGSIGPMKNLTSGMVWKTWDNFGDQPIPDTGGRMIVSPNRHLENGRRIEKWYPELPFKTPIPHSPVTQFKVEVGSMPWVVVAPLERHYFGHQQLMPAMWGRICKEIERTVGPVLLVGHERSAEFLVEIMRYWDPTLEPAMGVPLPELVPVFEHAKAYVGPACGLSILCTYMEKPVLHAYPRWLAQMPGTWEQPGHRSDACFVDELELAIMEGFLQNILARQPVQMIVEHPEDFAEAAGVFRPGAMLPYREDPREVAP